MTPGSSVAAHLASLASGVKAATSSARGVRFCMLRACRAPMRPRPAMATFSLRGAIVKGWKEVKMGRECQELVCVSFREFCETRENDFWLCDNASCKGGWTWCFDGKNLKRPLYQGPWDPALYIDLSSVPSSRILDKSCIVKSRGGKARLPVLSW